MIKASIFLLSIVLFFENCASDPLDGGFETTFIGEGLPVEHVDERTFKELFRIAQGLSPEERDNVKYGKVSVYKNEKRQQFKCKYKDCDKRFVSIPGYTDHLFRVHGEKFKTGPFKEEFSELVIRDEPQEILCEHCGKLLKTWAAKTNHEAFCTENPERRNIVRKKRVRPKVF